MWSLEELSDQVSRALGALGLVPANGQVAEVPNARTIRYYTTIGLLDRPGSDGRHATYGTRHLEQLIAIKRLQADGLPLAEVHRRLLQMDDAALTAFAAVPATEQVAPQGPGPRVRSRRADAFWTSSPSAPGPAVVVATVGTKVVQGGAVSLSLDVGQVTLSFPTARLLDAHDMEALGAALQVVVDTLRARGLVPPKEPA
jgi:hypothetical protein